MGNESVQALDPRGHAALSGHPLEHLATVPALDVVPRSRRIAVGELGIDCETAYVLLEPEPVPEAEAAVPGEGAAGEAQAPPWYTQLWGSVRAADRPAAE